MNEDALLLGSNGSSTQTEKTFPEKVAVFFWSTHCHLFFDLPVAIYERKLLDLISRKLKTCKIHLPQTNGQRDRETEI